MVANGMTCGDSSSRDKVALPILPVWVRGCGQVNYSWTLARLDSGSNKTFCSPAPASKLRLEGIESKFSLEAPMSPMLLGLFLARIRMERSL